MFLAECFSQPFQKREPHHRLNPCRGWNFAADFTKRRPCPACCIVINHWLLRSNGHGGEMNGIQSWPGKSQLPVQEKTTRTRFLGVRSMGDGHFPAAILSIIFLGENAAVLRLLARHSCFAPAVVCALSPTTPDL
jgi:hypothetical protein